MIISYSKHNVKGGSTEFFREYIYFPTLSIYYVGITISILKHR